MRPLARITMLLLLRLLLPLVVLVVLAGGLRSALLWRDQARLATAGTQQFVANFQALYGPRLVELQAWGQTAELQAVLDKGQTRLVVAG